ncbi:hypothetical protein TRVA0_002S04720 [Trichomonascus vanleenenianus]|uniref:F-box protein n=1 Tax=Trichomonascus vanleenenianus TaxID=2268995 RepID=UPI003ECA3A6E
MDYSLKVPPEIWRIIFGYLDVTILSCLLVCARFNSVAEATLRASVHMSDHEPTEIRLAVGGAPIRVVKEFDRGYNSLLQKHEWIRTVSLNLSKRVWARNVVFELTPMFRLNPDQFVLSFEYGAFYIDDDDRLPRLIKCLEKGLQAKIIIELNHGEWFTRSLEDMKKLTRVSKQLAEMKLDKEFRLRIYGDSSLSTALHAIAEYTTRCNIRIYQSSWKLVQGWVSRAPNLVHFSIVMMDSREDPESVPNVVLPESLRTLEVKSDHQVAITAPNCLRVACDGPILPQFTCPKLETLNLALKSTSGQLEEAVAVVSTLSPRYLEVSLGSFKEISLLSRLISFARDKATLIIDPDNYRLVRNNPDPGYVRAKSSLAKLCDLEVSCDEFELNISRLNMAIGIDEYLLNVIKGLVTHNPNLLRITIPFSNATVQCHVPTARITLTRPINENPTTFDALVRDIKSILLRCSSNNARRISYSSASNNNACKT